MALSLTHKMMLSVGSVSAAALLGLVWLTSMYLRQSSEDLIDARMQATAMMAASVLADAVITRDLATIDATVNQILAGQYGAVRVCVFNREGVRLSTGRCLQSKDEPHLGTHIREADISYGGDTQGHVGIAYEHDGMLPNLAKIERELFLASVVATASAVFAVWLIGHRFDLELANMVDSIGKIPTPRHLRRSSVQELDKIAQKFNQLLEQRRTETKGNG